MLEAVLWTGQGHEGDWRVKRNSYLTWISCFFVFILQLALWYANQSMHNPNGHWLWDLCNAATGLKWRFMVQQVGIWCLPWVCGYRCSSWPAGFLLSEFALSHPELFYGQNCLEVCISENCYLVWCGCSDLSLSFLQNAWPTHAVHLCRDLGYCSSVVQIIPSRNFLVLVTYCRVLYFACA
jgi:hypothetical protein